MRSWRENPRHVNTKYRRNIVKKRGVDFVAVTYSLPAIMLMLKKNNFFSAWRWCLKMHFNVVNRNVIWIADVTVQVNYLMTALSYSVSLNIPRGRLLVEFLSRRKSCRKFSRRDSERIPAWRWESSCQLTATTSGNGHRVNIRCSRQPERN